MRISAYKASMYEGTIMMVYMMFSDWAEVSGTYGKVKGLIWLLGYNQDPTVNSDYIN